MPAPGPGWLHPSRWKPPAQALPSQAARTHSLGRADTPLTRHAHHGDVGGNAHPEKTHHKPHRRWLWPVIHFPHQCEDETTTDETTLTRALLSVCHADSLGDIRNTRNWQFLKDEVQDPRTQLQGKEEPSTFSWCLEQSTFFVEPSTFSWCFPHAPWSPSIIAGPAGGSTFSQQGWAELPP